MGINSNYVPEVVAELLTMELSPAVARWRTLDDAEADSQERFQYPLVEIEFPGAHLTRQEYGDPGNNIWAEGEGDAPTAFMVHVHVERGKDAIAKARQVMDAVCAIFCGRQYEGVEFFNALATYTDYGQGLTAGVSRSIEYRYEFLHR